MTIRQLIEQDIKGCLSKGPIQKDIFSAACADAWSALCALRARHRQGDLGVLELPVRQNDQATLAPLITRWRGAFDRVIILGTGGSSLGSQALQALAPTEGPVIDIVETIDPTYFSRLISHIDMSRTGLIAISKSGVTVETLAQTLIVLEALQSAVGKEGVKNRMIVVTAPGDSPLDRLAREWQIPILPHDADLSGRYSVLSLVGLLPAALMGLDIKALCQGAASVLNEAIDAVDIERCSPALGAALNKAAEIAGLNVAVLMTYADQLANFANWWRQLWAESLGKRGRGTTPLIARCPVDQHSQLQLWLDGPADKLYTLITVDAHGQGPVIDENLAWKIGLDWLAGRHLGDLVAVQTEATLASLIAVNRPVRRLHLKRMRERELGALFMYFQLETMIAAEMAGVNPFDQPAVDDGKQRAWSMMRA